MPETIGIYDIIDEPTRNGKTRPFPYRAFMNTYEFAKIIRDKLPNQQIIVYRSVKPFDTYENIVADIRQHQELFPILVIVGNSQNKSVHTNTLITKVFSECENIIIGCVLLPGRKNEMNICMERIKLGVSFFISQIFVSPNMIIPFITQLPVRVWTTIIPIENDTTIQMYNWLNGSETLIDLQTYPNELIDARFTDICFESITYTHSSRFVEFIKSF